ncbi:MAG: DUF3142 domain-containing protein [Kofleriaceae bacterium]|jgi:hypothetical protein|nr:DUF3142 domain-containing protein [Kofleriaceae bacterium]MBP9171131.1 DUF3142 domain-containing protein [Kofleriaceae bacterium]
MGRTLLALACLAGVACTAPVRPRSEPLPHDAYVWQRAWTGAVRAAAAAPPDAIGALRVLAVEFDRGGAHWPAVDLAALTASRRPVVLVARIDGRRRPEELPRRDLIAAAARWQAAGVAVRGLEIDFDCATGQLADYARWLVEARPPAPLGWSITALPTWADSRALPAVAAAVDELVVQVHAVRAPAIFTAATARRELRRFAAAVAPRPLRVALPTYDAWVAGALRRSDPLEVASFVRWLETTAAPPIAGVVWFRLPVLGDDRAWSSTTLAAVIAGAPLAPALTAAVAPAGAERFDVVLVNRGTIAAPWPDLTLTGADLRAELVGGYRLAADHRYLAPGRTLAPGARAVVGWATGKDVIVHAVP